jgi:hypothetical protein
MKREDDGTGDIERSYDLVAVISAHRAVCERRGSWRRLSDMEYDTIAAAVLCYHPGEAGSEAQEWKAEAYRLRTIINEATKQDAETCKRWLIDARRAGG